MKNITVLLLSLLLVAGLALFGWRWWRGEPPAWTVRSPEALKAFETGLDLLMKEYRPEARAAFERALELDDEMVAARLFLIFTSRGLEDESLRDELAPERMARLTPRERFILEFHFAWVDGADKERLEQIVDDYLERYPGDPYALREKCHLAWDEDNWEEVQGCYARLLEEHPNWVIAQQRLGSVALAFGRFEEAEEQFRTYLYIAPDQANPYSSLGALLTLRGRYDEAEQVLRQGLEIKPDFCQLGKNLAWLYIFSGRFVDAEQALDELMAIEVCAAETGDYVCTVRTLIDLLQGDFDAARTIVDGGCLDNNQGFYPAAHRLAVASGELAEAERMEAYLRQRIDKHADRKYVAQGLTAILAHAEGVRLFFTGEPAAAAERFREADALLPFWGTNESVFKLFNLLNLAYSLKAAGSEAEATAVYEQIETINPSFAEAHLDDLEGLIASPKTIAGRAGEGGS